MKKLTLLILALALSASLIACGGTSDTEDTPDTEPTVTDTADTEPDATATEDGTYTLLLNSIAVTLGGDADGLIAILGEPLDYMEAPSCIHEGYDKVYVFDGYSITTSPRADGTQYVSTLDLTSDVAIIDGTLTIGGSVSDVEALFGAEYTENFGVRVYALSGASASVTLDGDTVVGITITAN